MENQRQSSTVGVYSPGRTKPQHGRIDRRLSVPSAPQAHRGRRISRRGVDLLGRGFALGLFFWGAVFTITAAMPTDAARPLGWKWEKTSLGFSADSRAAGYTANAMALWTGSSGLTAWQGGTDIEIIVAPLRQPIDHAEQSAQANVSWSGRTPVHCEVRLDPNAFFALNEMGRQNVVTHEIGHCLGLDHSDKAGVMMNPLFYGFSADDAAGIASLYPRAASSTVAASTPATAAPTQPALPTAAPSSPASVNPSLPQGIGSSAQRAVAAPPVPAVPPAPRDYGGGLPPGWTYVAWDGPASSPVGCGCAAVYRLDGAIWSGWDPSSGVNTLTSLLPGVTYWMRQP